MSAFLFLLGACAFSFSSYANDEWIPHKGVCDEVPSQVNHTEITADLDHNGVPDVARLQQNPKTKAVRLAVWMNKAATPLVAFESTKDTGESLTLLAEARKKPNFGREKEIKSYPALVYTKCATFDAYFFWDGSKFQSVWDWN